MKKFICKNCKKVQKQKEMRVSKGINFKKFNCKTKSCNVMMIVEFDELEPVYHCNVIHKIKINATEYLEYFSVCKSYWIMKNDKLYKTGDILILKESTGEREFIPIEKSKVLVTQVLESTPQNGLIDGYCILSISPIILI